MRDASNLAWKLDLVLGGSADDTLLDSYEQERRPHAQKLMLDSRSLGQVANTANPVKAAVRDLLFRWKLTPKPAFPILTAGVLAHDANGKPMREAGTLTAQGRLAVGAKVLRFDEHVGFGFALVARQDPRRELGSDLQRALQCVGVRFITVGDGAAADGVGQVGDVDAVYGRALHALGADAMLIRPDFVLYGHATRDRVAPLLEGLLRALKYSRSRVADRGSVAA